MHRQSVPFGAFFAICLVSVACAGEPHCPGDVDGDLRCNINDLGAVLANMNCMGGGCPGDADGDGNTNVNDLGIVLANQNTNCFVDLDIDSDNTNGNGAPDRTAAEDALEADDSEPGKFILVNDDDDDQNGVPDKDQSGAISSEQDDLVPVVLEITPSAGGITAIDYRFSYDPARIRLWTSANRGTSVPPQQVGSYNVAAGPVTLWAESLTSSAAGADVSLAAEADPDDNGSFDSSDSVSLTAVALAYAPTTGTPGTPVTWTLSLAVEPLGFDSSTSALWTGRYLPDPGSPTSTFSVAYSSAQTRESSSSAAALLLGDGAFQSSPPIGLVSSSGQLHGHLAFDFGNGLTLRRSSQIQLIASVARWELVNYPADGLGPPTLGGPATTLGVFDVQPGSSPSEALLLSAYDYHYGAVVRIEQNPTTLASAPSQLVVDLVALNGLEAEFNRLEDLLLFRDESDGDTANITYVNDLTTPITFVDEDLNQAEYPGVVPFYVVHGGSAIIVPADSN